MEEDKGIKRKLKLGHIIALGLAYMAPFAVFDTFGIASNVSSGHVPMAYVFVFLAILITAFCYSKLVKKYPSSGSVYVYTSKTISPYLGILVGWMSFIAYLSLPMINAVLAKIWLSILFPSLPSWIWVIALVLLITTLNILGIEFAATINIALVFLQMLVGIIFVILTIIDIKEGTGDFLNIQGLLPHINELGGFFGASALLGMSFIGFDAITTLAEDTVNPQKNIPLGIFSIATIGGIFFFVITYFMQSLIPDVTILNNIQGASPEIATIVGGKLYLVFFIVGGVFSVIASGLAAQISASRLLYAMGRDNVIPRSIFGYLHNKTNTPIFNILLTGFIALAALFLSLEQATSLVNVGAFTSFMFVNICVMKNFLFKTNKKKLFITEFILPLLGFAFIIYLWINLNSFALYIAVIWLSIGCLYLLIAIKGFRKEIKNIDFNELN